MNSDELKRNWGQLRGKIRPRWTALTDEDVANINGNRDTLFAMLREKYGYSEMQANTEIDRFLAENFASTAA